MLNFGKIALSIAGVETAIWGIGFRHYKRKIDETNLSKYSMTAKEYVNTVMTATSVDDYNKQLKGLSR